MKVGDLISDKEFPDEVGLIVDVKDRRTKEPYRVLCPTGETIWFGKKYIESECEVVSESR